MTSKTTVLIGLAAILAGRYIYYFTDLFRSPTIQIFSQTRPMPAAGLQSTVYFSFKGKQKLTAIRILTVASLETNKFPIPAWQLISDSNSVPVKGFLYGGVIAGMKPAKIKPQPDNLQPNTVYRVFVEAGRAKGQIDFRTPPE